MIKSLRKNIGSIIAFFGFFLLCIITFGDLGNITTEEYWQNVLANITGIGFVSVSLTLIQVSIKQGISEQALQKGLNTENATDRMLEHRNLIATKQERLKFLPYFLQSYNERQTKLKKQEFLVTNNYKSEDTLYKSKNRKAIKKYRKIITLITPSSIKWATTDIVYKPNGQIVTLSEHRRKRALFGFIKSAFSMVAAAFLVKGIFLDSTSSETLLEKFIMLGTYIIVIIMTSVLSVVKEYEKGAFGVPNELEEINQIWREFHNWEIPQSVIKELEKIDNMEVDNEEEKDGSKCRANVPPEQKKGESISKTCTDNNNSISCTSSNILLANDRK